MSNLKIRKQLISDTPYKYGRNNGKRYITVHMTDNWRNGANAQAHANLQSNGNARNASWHWQVDDTLAIQSFTHDFQLWAGGDGRGDGNLNSIHVEICVNKDGNYKQSVKNGALLVQHIMKLENIPLSNVVQHNKWSGKNCPSDLRRGRDGITWTDFINMVKGSKVKPVPTKPDSRPVHQQYTGDSIVTYLDTLGIDSSFSNRAKLARQYGISNYKGTAQQNLSLLAKMRNGEPSKPSVNTSKPASKPAPKKSSQPTVYKVGQKVKIKPSASKYSRSTASIPSRYKNKTYTIQQVGNNDVLLKELYSWVRKSDLVGHTNTSTSSSTTTQSNSRTFRVGQTVTVKKNAKTFATGQPIASFVKGSKYRILQVKSDRVLLDGIMSWVRKSDIS